MDGSTTQQHDVLATKIRDLVTFSSQTIHRLMLLWRGFHTTLFRSLLFPLATTTLALKDLRSLQRDLNLFLLPKLRLPRSFPITSRHGPSAFMGTGLPNLELEQGIAQLTALLENSAIPSTPGNLLMTTMEATQLEIGTSTPFFTLPFRTHSHLVTDTWVKSLWNFIDVHGLFIEGPPLVPPTDSPHSTFLMDIAIPGHPPCNTTRHQQSTNGL